MTRVLHSTELELRANLAAAADLDAVVRVHAEFIARVFDRCFLHDSAQLLRNAILKGTCKN